MAVAAVFILLGTIAAARAGVPSGAQAGRAFRATRLAEIAAAGHAPDGTPTGGLGPGAWTGAPPAWLTARAAEADTGGVIDVRTFGADPTGARDSAAAIRAAIAAALNRTAALPGPASGNVVVSLEGGRFRVDSPVTFPASGGGYVTLRSGALVAGPDFPADGFLLDMRAGSFVYTSFLGLFLDSAHSGGGLALSGSLRTSVTDCYFSRFSTTGLLGDAEAKGGGSGHELYVSDSFFAEYEFGTGAFDNTTAKTGTAVEMRFPDSAFTSVVILCSKAGVVDHGGNQYSAVHIYTTCSSKRDYTPGETTVAAAAVGSVTRFESCYFDNAVLRAADPYVLSVSDGVFFGSARLILAPSKRASSVYGLYVAGNQFQCESGHCPDILIEPGAEGGSFSSAGIVRTTVQDNWYGSSVPARATRVEAAVRVSNATSAAVDLSSLLVFPGVGAGTVQYSIRLHASSPSKFFRHSLGDWDDAKNQIYVQTDEPISAVVYFAVDQSAVVTLQ